MIRSARWFLFPTLLAALLSACSQAGGVEPTAQPALVVEEIPGSDLARLSLSARAAERLGIATSPVTTRTDGVDTRRVIPFSAVLYDADGGTWAYANPELLTYERVTIDVLFVDGEEAILAVGPPPGTMVVTTGAAELWGAESGISGGH